MRFRPAFFICPLARGGRRSLKRHQYRLEQSWPRLQGSNWGDPVESRRANNEPGWILFDDTLDPYAPEQSARRVPLSARSLWERGRWTCLVF
ncbi:hypothetical protein GFM18_27095 [Rhizobium laguerreae]|nr:hypothetical protein [Rhizobium laguerreae]